MDGYNETITYGSGISFRCSIDDTEKIVRLANYIGDAAVVVIPAQLTLYGENYSVMISAPGLFSGNKIIQSVLFQSVGSKKITTEGKCLENTFLECPNLASINFEGLNTTGSTSMRYMFEDVPKLKYLDLGNFDTSSVTDMNAMFEYDVTLETINLSSFDTRNLTDATDMFYGCYQLKELDLSSFELDNLKEDGNMLKSCGYYGHSRLDTLVTPKSIGDDVELELEHVMCDNQGNYYTHLDSTTPITTRLHKYCIAPEKSGKKILVKNVGTEYQLKTAAESIDYLYLQGIPAGKYAVEYTTPIDRAKGAIVMNIQTDDFVTTRNDRFYGKGKVGQGGFGPEKSVVIEIQENHDYVISCQYRDTPEELLEYTLRFKQIPIITDVRVDNENSIVQEGGYNWWGLSGWPLDVTYSDGSTQYITSPWTGSYILTDDLEESEKNPYLLTDDYGNKFYEALTDDISLYDSEWRVGKAGNYQGEITVGSQKFSVIYSIKTSDGTIISDKIQRQEDDNSETIGVGQPSITTGGFGNDGKSETTVNDRINVSGISITAPSKKLAAGKKAQLSVTVTPADATNQNVTWTVSGTKYASVSKTGKLTLKTAGVGKTVTITAAAKDGSGVKATYKIKIMQNAVTKVQIKKGSKTLKNGKTITGKAGSSVKLKSAVKVTNKKGKVKSAYKANKTLNWTSSNTKYATVNKSGKVKLLKAGKGKTVTITATATDGSGKKAKVKIKIK